MERSMAEISGDALDNITIEGLELHQSGLSSLASLFVEPRTVETGQKFLRCRLCSENTALLPVNEIAAVLTIETKAVLPVPHMPGCVLGIYNWRGEVLWLLDLAGQVGLSPLAKQNQPLTTFMAIVVEAREGQLLGLAIPEVQEIELHDPQYLHPPSAGLFPPHLLPFVKGYLTGDRSTVLDIASILQDPQLHIHELN
jgi:positive phototaxis protein PixI